MTSSDFCCVAMPRTLSDRDFHVVWNPGNSKREDSFIHVKFLKSLE